MLRRYAVAGCVSAAITFGLFYTMQWLVAGRQVVVEQPKKRWDLDFIRLKRTEEVNTKERQKPRKLERPQPPPQAAPMAKAEGPAQIDVDIPIETANLALSGDGPFMGGGDSDIVPMVRVNPEYPTRAAARGIEGWVHLKFTVTAQGSTSDVEVVDADPRGYFETAAVSAVKRYKYKPRIENGTAVARPDVEVVLSFQLEK
jgi:protein TonB